MNRSSSKHSLIGRHVHTNGRYNAPAAGLSSHRRIMSFTATTEDFISMQVKLDRLSAGSTKSAKSILDDLLSSNVGENHDYDWLLTPPETALLPSSNGKETQPKSVATRRNFLVRSGSTNRTSKVVPPPPPPTYFLPNVITNSSVSQSVGNHLATPARSSSVSRPSVSTAQNTSSASVSSHRRPSTPTNRSPSAARPSIASSRPTPSKSRTSSNTTIRPSTLTPHPQSHTVQPASRPSTPTHSNPTSFKNRSVGSTPNSSVSRARGPPQAFNLLDFPNETPPNLRTSMPERPVSAGRFRPSAAMTVKGNVEYTNMRNSHHPLSLGDDLQNHLDGMSTSKKSFDMAIKHMDIRTRGARPLPGSTRFPESIRSSHGSSASNNLNSNYGNFKNGYSMKPVSIDYKSPCHSKLTQVDVYESLRYDSILLKEDLKNTSWLHRADENSDQSSLFDHGFESLPEPFAPL
ncbi:hypothetical protein E3N88_45603 [Mikania micrantha]|uniref:Uncharacterized protein n=1 Tax=Mikania micrantha TaxID=192012 RepID=A0A5N6L9A4_9ASTR|nr:hypothetical protein E3N88_45603 [Mikania micrantha]